MSHNPNCDGEKCQSDTGEVRVLPISIEPHHGNLILCWYCFCCEITWRRKRNQELAPENRFDLPKWKDLKVYDTENEKVA